MARDLKIAWNSTDFIGEPEDRAAAMVKEALAIEDQPESMFAADRDLALIRMFEQAPVTALTTYGGRALGTNAASIASSFVTEVSPYNYLRAIVSTAHAMLARSKVRGRFLTTDGTGIQKKRAKSATQWLDGWAAEEHVHELAGQALLDAMVCKFGVLQIFEEDNKVRLQRVLPHEITYDMASAMYGTPRTIHRRRGISVATLAAKFPKKKDEILAANTIPGPDGSYSDLLLVREAWSLPSSKKAKDGYHVIALDNGTPLLVEPYVKQWFPLIFFFWDKSMVGMGGVSLAALLETMQAELNRYVYVERQATKFMAVPRVWFKRNSRVEKTPKLTNGIGSIVESDVAPQPLIWPPLPEQFYRAKDKLIESMYQIVGISRTASEGVKPQGTESGVAQREAMETQNVRIQIYAQRSWEAPIVEIFQRAVEMAADIVADGHEYEVSAPGPHGISSVDFKGVVSDLKSYKVSCFPTGALPLTPAARLDYVKSMLDAGLWDIDRARAAFADLDVESENSLENSILRMFSEAFEEMLFEGKATRPSELDVAHYEVAMKTASVYLALARTEKTIPERNVSLAQRYVQELQSLKAKSEPPPPPAPPAAGPQDAAPPIAA